MERLTKYFKPESYKLKLRINKETELVQGIVVIKGEKPGEKLKLYAKNNLNLAFITINNGDLRKIHREDDDVIEILDVEETGEIFITIRYSFKLSHNMQGAYLSTYQHQGKEERIVSTQFESHYARECFPCIDEPEAKATFELGIIDTDVEDTIISNMPVKSEEILEYNSVNPDADPSKGVDLNTKVKRKVVNFLPTPKMSTYLLAFCLGKFQKVSSKTSSGTAVSTYCTLAHPKESVKYANDVAIKALEYYDSKFGVKYPLEKLDQIAIPDFEAGAMENWGLVTYRESCLLVDKNTTIDAKEYVATVIAHELSHQWFGNLVTMKWWDNLWLNESFANLMEYICVDAIFPEYQIWQDFFTGDCLAALMRDSLPGVQAVQQDVSDPAEIATLFDGAIVYAKGARLMFYLYRLMGEKAFFSGLKSYFKRHQYGNTTGDDLWAALQPHAKFDVKEFMDAWITQPGYPVVTDDSQQRFLITGATDDTKWPLEKVTDDMSGHYLVNLSSSEFTEKLQNFDNLSLEQRLRLLIDRTLLAKTSLVSSASLIELLPHFRTETSYPIWEMITTILGSLKLFFTPDSPDYRDFQRYVAYLIESNLSRLGIGNQRGAKETENDTKLRQLILAHAYFAENQEINAALAKLYQDDYTKLDKELRLGIIRAKLRAADQENPKNSFLETLILRYREEANPDIRSDLLATIAGSKYHQKELISLLKQPEIVRPQDHLYLFAYLSRNFYTHEAAFAWLTENWDYLEQLTGEKSIEDYPRILAGTIRTKEDAERFDDFFGALKNKPVLRRTIEIATGEINARLRLISMDDADVHAKFKEFISQLNADALKKA